MTSATAPQTLEFRTPLEPTPPTLGTLLERAWPEGTDAQRRSVLEEGLVRVDGVVQKKPDHTPQEDTLVEVELHRVGAELFGIPEVAELERAARWVLVEKPVGMPGSLVREDPMHPVLFMADSLGLDRQGFTPVWAMPTQAGGPWLIAHTPEAAGELQAAYRGGQMMLTWMVLVPRLPLPRGQVMGEGGVPITYSVTQYKGGLCEVQLIPGYSKDSALTRVNPVELVLGALAGMDAPVLGDRERGGHMVQGGLKLRLAVVLDEKHGLGHSWEAPRGWWPTAEVIAWGQQDEEEDDQGVSYPSEPQQPPSEAPQKARARRESRPDFDSPDPDILPPLKPSAHAQTASRLPTLKVSAKTLEIMEEQGHPWVLTDRQTGNRAHLKPGTVVGLVGAGGRGQGPWALVEGPGGEIAARFWAPAWDVKAATQLVHEVNTRVDRAMARRTVQFQEMAQTDLFRLIHGQADGLPGLLVDRVGSLWRATVTSLVTRAFKRAVYARMLEHDTMATLIEVTHTEDVRAGGDVLPRAKTIQTSSLTDRQDRLIGHEDGLRYWCEPWEGIDTGFFPDQRDNRRRLAQHAAPGQRWLNLFGHTGAFSVALAARGAHVVNVDVSKRYLDWTAQNFALNGLDAGLNHGVPQDARAYVATMREEGRRFFGIVLDPPTAAKGAGGFWSIRKDFEGLLRECFALLEPDGVMLVCRNDRKGRGSLTQLVTEVAEAAGWPLGHMEPAGPSADYPSLPGFPEGDPFEGVFVMGRG